MEKKMIIEGMMCQHCQKHVHDALAAMDGVTAVTVDLEGKKADVTTSKDIPTEAFAKVIADAGQTAGRNLDFLLLPVLAQTAGEILDMGQKATVIIQIVIVPDNAVFSEDVIDDIH